MPLSCALCDSKRKLNKNSYTTVQDPVIAQRIEQAYKDDKNASLSTTVLSQQVHKKCYWKYWHHYDYLRNTKSLSSKPEHHPFRLPLSDRTNNQVSLSSVQTKNTSLCATNFHDEVIYFSIY
jgi:hypothetical protein